MTSPFQHFVTFSFVTPSSESCRASSYQKLKRKCAENVQQDELFSKGLLLETMENGVTYPVVHFEPSHHYSCIKDSKTNDPRQSDNYLVEHGLYQELSSIRADLFGSALDDLVTLEHEARRTWRRFYLLLGFKQQPTLAYSNVMEIHWKDWTGARYLFLNLPDEFGLSRLTFYKRLDPTDVGLFLYIVLVECIRVTSDDEVALQDFVQRMRADKMPFYLALYEESDVDTDRDQRTPFYTRLSGRLRSLSGSTGLGSMESSLSDDRPGSRSTAKTESPTFFPPIQMFQPQCHTSKF